MMSQPTGLNQLAATYMAHQPEVERLLQEVFTRHAIDNRGLLTSARYSEQVARQLAALAGRFLRDGEEDGEKHSQTDVTQAAVEMAEQGMALITAVQLLRTLVNIPWSTIAGVEMGTAVVQKLAEFQLQFLEKLAEARQALQQRSQEQAQQALQRALHNQLQQQRTLHQVQQQRSERLRHILQLNARLARITNEDQLLNEAVSGICQAMELADVTLYELHLPENTWTIRTTTAANNQPDHLLAPAILDLLKTALQEDEMILTTETIEAGQEAFALLLLLRAGQKVLGAILARSNDLSGRQAYDQEEFSILLQTFAQNLGALWRNLTLFNETRQRAHELEILHGRYVDSIWNTPTAALRASYYDNRFHLFRQPQSMVSEEPSPAHSQVIPLTIGDQAFGHLFLPGDRLLGEEEAGFVQALVREMANALNNAHLLQTTRSYSNQLALATEVSRAATTILDREHLIQQVVELIRARFNLYYVGLFLVDEATKMAVLHAGTGEAGRLQVARGHRHRLDGRSMVSATITRGEALVEQDISQAQAFSFNPLLPLTRSELALPLRTRGRVIGALSVQSIDVGAFAPDTIIVLQNLADQLAVAIENAGLFAQLQVALAEASSLYQTSRRMSEASDQNDVFQALIDFVRQSGAVDSAQVIVADPDDPDYFTSPAMWSRDRRGLLTSSVATKDGRYPRSLFPFIKTPVQSEVVVIDEHEALDEPTRLLYRQNNIRTVALIPLYTESDWLSVLVLYRTQEDPFTEQIQQPFQTLAEQAAVILANQRLFAEIQAANEQLRQLDQLKTQFLANMSHELRTPLNSIIGFSRVILKGIDGPITADQAEDLTSIHNNGQHLLRLINEILDMAKIEAGKLALAFEPVDLEEIAQAALSTVRSLANEKNLEVRWQIETPLPLIEADPVRLRQILINLLSNAAKYTDEGHISLKITQSEEEQVHIAVSDTGIGIAPQDFDKLFKAFEQIDSSTTRAVGGTGLGLPITKWLVTMHQGSISLESQVGQGTTFYVSLPVRQNKEVESHITFHESLSALH